ncbi:hypothetical protein BG006_000739 [Podila minutissima]|uniref:Uncharacterized protein n=1 Tax=Podila minutissima TaxID=64525 RepID=A0A9P5SDU9_9FUNG|nr:hypothetical protein BG006_000739 [Podila minutissima]
MKIFIGLAAIASVAFADISFNVVGYPSSNAGAFGVSVGGKITKLFSNETSFPVWPGTVPSTDNNVEYSNVELFASGNPDLPKIPYTYLATYLSKTKASKQNQIATIHVTAPAAQISPENDKSYYTFFHRPNIKLRSMVMDPTMMREKLYIDMLNSAGIPTQQGAWVRLFINNEPYGLYLIIDDIKRSFRKQTVHGGDASIQRGSLVQGNAFIKKADLMYKGLTSKDYDPDCYVSQDLGNNPADDPLKELISLMSDLKSFDPATPNANETRFDLDGVLRNMALKYLGVDTYKNWYDFKDGDHPLVSKLILQNKDINALFEQVLKELVSTTFKPEALVPHIQTYNKMLSLNAQWDISLTRKSPGINNGFTFDDFNNNLNVGTKDMSFGLIPFVLQISDYVAQELGFTIPAGLANRVVLPAKGGNEDDDKNDSSESDKDNNSKNNAGSRAVSG